jgi:hypothetical protein
MRSLRFSLSGLLAGVALAAVGCTALMYASPGWVRGVLTVVWILLVAAAAGALVLRGAARAFCIGAAVFGGSYLTLQPAWPDSDHGDQRPLVQLGDRLATDWLLELAYDKLLAPQWAGGNSPTGAAALGWYSQHSGAPAAGDDPGGLSLPSPELPGAPARTGWQNAKAAGTPGDSAWQRIAAGPAPGGAGGPRRSFVPQRDDFLSVGHGLWTVLLALVGGVFGSYLYPLGEKRRES